ncbi:MAG TPA: cytochrome c3 family protein [Thermoanaerobaculia bacterium]|nr:cytochrome c3 family protein [Thermoanaerobaculia bacterium]
MKRVTISFCLLLSALSLSAKNHAYRATAHGRNAQRRADSPRGSCIQCHDYRAPSLLSPAETKGLFTANDNELCFTCHAAASDDGVFPGNAIWLRSAHATSANGANECVDCHDPHGVKDRGGVIPSLLSARTPDLCLGCHDGSRGADIRGELMKTYRHGMNAHGGRRVDCTDCHNTHQAIKDPAPPSPPEASYRLASVSRVEVVNGGAGVVPSYRWHPANDPAIAINEFEICFKCHSSASKQKQPVGQPDLALLTNPANASFHPIQSEGKNPNIDPAAFANGFDARGRVSCTSCHESHASDHEFLARKPGNELCFECHALDVYGNNASDALTRRASRFDTHADHTARGVACNACHDAHGSIRHEALIRIAGFDGITTFTQTPTGGTCTSGCHAPRTYSVNYAR